MTRRRVFEWIVTVMVGIVAIAFVLNRGLFTQPTHSKAYKGSASASAIAIDGAAHTLLTHMSQDEKIGQLMVPMAFDDNSMDAQNGDMRTLIQTYHVGGIFIPTFSMSANELHNYIAQMQATSKIPLIISTDFEGGGWNTLDAEVGSRPSPWGVGQSGDTKQAYSKGIGDAQLLTQLGLNVDYAPVVDVLTNPNNPILQGRTFGTTPDVVTSMAAAYIDGLRDGGVAGCLKHFPGLGASTVDPHKSLPTVDRSADQLKSIDLKPYRDLLAQNRVPMIMTTHMIIPSLDPDLPTSISPKVINGLLRHDMGYDGVIVSDALFMGGLSYKYNIPTAGLLAFEAGTDMLLGAGGASDVLATINLIKDAMGRNEITQEYLDNAVLRILRFKIQWKIIPPITLSAAIPQNTNTVAFIAPLPENVPTRKVATNAA